MPEPRHLDELGKVHLCSECYVLKDDQVLMFKRSETASKFPGVWIGPGGHINEGEDILAAAIREIYEEAGIKVTLDQIKLKAVSFHHHTDKKEVWISFYFLATISAYQQEKKQDSEGKGQAKWIPLKELLIMDNIFPPSKHYFDHILNDKPGIMYTTAQCENSQLVKVLSQRIDITG